MDEFIGMLQSMKTVLDDVMKRMEVLEKRQGDIESMVIKEFLDPLKESVDTFKHDQKVEAFKEKVGDKFDPYLEMAAQVNGPDYDIYSALSDSYDNFENDNPGATKPTEEEFIAGAVDMLEEQAQALKKALGAEDVEIKTDGETTEAVVDGEKMTEEEIEEAIEENKEETAEEPATEETSEEVKEESSETEPEEKTEEEASEEESEEDSPEEVEADYKKLLEEMGK